MAVDYYILRKKKLDINNMYNKQGVFKGVNWAAIIAIIVGSLCSLIIVQPVMVCKPDSDRTGVLLPDEDDEEFRAIQDRDSV